MSLLAPLLLALAPTYDYVVVGAGAAGSVLAARLSEDPGRTVLVLEAGGPDDDPRIARPSAYRSLAGSDLDWRLETEEEEHLAGRRIPWPRGKVWGGSGSISAMIYVRGPARDFDRWRDLGNAGWGFADLLPCFEKAENQVAAPRWVPPLSRAFLEASREAGIARNPDFNGASQEGAGLYPLNQRNGERHSAAAAYLRPALSRPNLTVESHALATRVLVRAGRAAGVAWARAGKEHEALARREVILCAGTIGSPQLLMLSGIGPAAHLRSLGITVVLDLPGVGGNLQDHPRVPVAWESNAPLGLGAEEEARAAAEYDRDRSGPLTSPGVGAGAFVRTRPSEEEPDVQIVPVASPAAGSFSLTVALMRPESRGEVRLRSPDPTAPPLIRARYLSAGSDMEGLLRGIAVAVRIASSPALSPFRGRPLFPAGGGEEALRRHVRENATTFFHPVGTCRMGTGADAVVDERLRVRGIAGLRVIDASVMPTLVGGATHAATVAIAEKGAEMLKADE